VTGIIVFAHGSTIASANDAVRAVTAELAQREGYGLTETAFLDCARPTLDDAVQSLLEKGAGHIVVIPYFLTLGVHLQQDLPRLVDEIRTRLGGAGEGVSIEVTDPLDGHPALVEIVADRARGAVHGGSRSASPAR